MTRFINTTSAAWYVVDPNPRRAGLRYRCLYPMSALQQLGCDVSLINSVATAIPDTVVFDGWTLFPTVTTSEIADKILNTARQLKERGIRIVLDNCDNQFAGENDKLWETGCTRLRELAMLADTVVVCSTYLAEVMQRVCRLETPPVVIYDPIEDEIRYPGDSKLRSFLSVNRKLSWLRYFKHWQTIRDEIRQGVTPLVWFGHHGTTLGDSGMHGLLSIKEALEHLAVRYPLSLTIISNHPGKFLELFHAWRLPVHYLNWDRVTFLKALRLHSISIIPTQINAFSSAKSANRAVLSLFHGLNVVCDPIPSYQELSRAIQIGDWEQSIEIYLLHPKLRAIHLESGRKIINSRFSLSAIAEQWRKVLFPNMS